MPRLIPNLIGLFICEDPSAPLTRPKRDADGKAVLDENGNEVAEPVLCWKVGSRLYFHPDRLELMYRWIAMRTSMEFRYTPAPLFPCVGHETSTARPARVQAERVGQQGMEAVPMRADRTPPEGHDRSTDFAIVRMLRMLVAIGFLWLVVMVAIIVVGAWRSCPPCDKRGRLDVPAERP